MSQKIRMIDGSLRCLNYGWLSFLPGLGLFFGALAIRSFVLVYLGAPDEWNPARAHLFSGAALAVLALLLHAVAIVAGVFAFL